MNVIRTFDSQRSIADASHGVTYEPNYLLELLSKTHRKMLNLFYDKALATHHYKCKKARCFLLHR